MEVFTMQSIRLTKRGDKNSCIFVQGNCKFLFFVLVIWSVLLYLLIGESWLLWKEIFLHRENGNSFHMNRYLSILFIMNRSEHPPFKLSATTYRGKTRKNEENRDTRWYTMIKLSGTIVTGRRNWWETFLYYLHEILLDFFQQWNAKGGRIPLYQETSVILFDKLHFILLSSFSD